MLFTYIMKDGFSGFHNQKIILMFPQKDCLKRLQLSSKNLKTINSRNFPGQMETFQTIRKLSRPSGNFPGHLETFQAIRKLCRPSGNFLDQMESFQALLKFSRSYGEFSGHLGAFQAICELSRPAGKCKNCLEV